MRSIWMAWSMNRRLSSRRDVRNTDGYIGWWRHRNCMFAFLAASGRTRWVDDDVPPRRRRMHAHRKQNMMSSSVNVSIARLSTILKNNPTVIDTHWRGAIQQQQYSLRPHKWAAWRMSTAWYKSRMPPKLLQQWISETKNNSKIAVEIWNTTCIVTNFGKSTYQTNDETEESNSHCHHILINPANPQLSGVSQFPYFPRGGPVPKKYPNKDAHHIMGYVRYALEMPKMIDSTYLSQKVCIHLIPFLTVFILFFPR